MGASVVQVLPTRFCSQVKEIHPTIFPKTLYSFGDKRSVVSTVCCK